MVYSMRSFVRFRRTFYVGIVSDYYRVLQQAQVLQNERVNRNNLQEALNRAQLLLEAGRMPRLEVDQTRQDVLRAENRLENAEQAYRAALDRFKVTLGLPTEVPLELDPAERDRIAENFGDVQGPEIEPERAAEVALRERLDLATTQDRIGDAERALHIARLNLRPGLSMTAGVGLETDTDQPLDFDPDNADFSVGAELDLPLDKLDERNAYRASQIALDRARRDYEDTRDGVVLEVRSALRQYYRSRRSYGILEESVRLARERVRSTSMLLEAGRASTRDMLEAREALLSAQNSLVQALVDYRLAGLELARDTGVLEVGPMGTLEENLNEYD
jgi:outer membrane protein TolC